MIMQAFGECVGFKDYTHNDISEWPFPASILKVNGDATISLVNHSRPAEQTVVSTQLSPQQLFK